MNIADIFIGKKDLDIVGIGDTVVDAFIKIDVGEVVQNHGETNYCVPFGAKIPFESVEVLKAVGNSANAMVSASRLGLKAGLITFLGNDNDGKDCLAELERNSVDTRFIVTEDGKKTNYHYVLWHGDERTILVKHADFASHLPSNLGKPKWIYLSSLGSHTKELHEELMGYLEVNPEVKLAFQPGTFQMQMGTETLKRLYARTEIFCANKEEYMKILNETSDNAKVLMDKMEALGPKIILLSDGPHGAFMKAESKYYQMGLYPDATPPLERTGAGDAFCSTFVSAIALGKTPQEALTWGPVNSMSVVHEVGAQKGLLTREKLLEYIAKAPADYTVKEM
jgi:sugar/nucleoside kinase (ribokinase family)